MLCRHTDIMRIDEVSGAYDIAWNYLQRTGAIKHPVTAHEEILATIASDFAKGQTNKIRLANKAIVAFLRQDLRFI